MIDQRGDTSALLGINTKLESALQNGANPEWVRRANRARKIIEQLEHGEEKQDYQAVRLAMLAFLRRALPGATGEFQTKTGKAKTEFRTKHCMGFIRYDMDFATFTYNDKSGQAGLRDVGLCGMVWPCPVCSERITAGRRRELKKLLAVNDRYFIIMVTYTMSHGEEELLKPMVDSLNYSIRRTKTGRPWKRFIAKWGIVGFISALEVTHGKNGWHPHKHEMFVIDREKIEEKGPEAKKRFETELQAELFAMYHHKLTEEGRDCDEEHGLVVSANRRDYGDYIDKWGVTEELTRSVHKIASGAGRSVWELLKSAMYGDMQDWSLWLEYVRAFKGKKQLHWSSGLRDLLNLGLEKSDEELAAEIDLPEEERPVVVVSQMGLTYIHSKDLAGPIVLYIKKTHGDVDQVLDYLARMGLRKFVMGGKTVPVSQQEAVGAKGNTIDV